MLEFLSQRGIIIEIPPQLMDFSIDGLLRRSLVLDELGVVLLQILQLAFHRVLLRRNLTDADAEFPFAVGRLSNGSHELMGLRFQRPVLVLVAFLIFIQITNPLRMPFGLQFQPRVFHAEGPKRFLAFGQQVLQLTNLSKQGGGYFGDEFNVMDAVCGKLTIPLLSRRRFYLARGSARLGRVVQHRSSLMRWSSQPIFIHTTAHDALGREEGPLSLTADIVILLFQRLELAA